jgi:hypothetical protein
VDSNYVTDVHISKSTNVTLASALVQIPTILLSIFLSTVEVFWRRWLSRRVDIEEV